jgi:ketol-acid reductoisomerase
VKETDMAAKIYRDGDANLDLVRGKKVAIVGYGSQGHAHALNLRDSGVDVRVGLHGGARSGARARDAGFVVQPVADVAAWADVLVLLAPDTAQPAIWTEHVAARLRPGATLMFAHGFNIRFQTIEPRADLDVVLVAPKGPGHRVRETFVAGAGVPALVAVAQDPSGTAWDTVLSYAAAIGATRAGALRTTFAEETETDLFGEQTVLCGGVSSLVKAAFETLVDAGYQPEVAYFECLHELKLIVDLMYRGGLNYMRYSVSDTAEYGDYVSGPRVVGGWTRVVMRSILDEIRSGAFARSWITENERGRPLFTSTRLRERAHPLEQIGASLRREIPFLDPVTTKPGD